MTVVLVLQVANRCGPWVCRSLRRAGYEVIGGDEADAKVARNLRCLSPYRYPSPIADPAGFLGTVVAICEEERVDVVLPSDDERVMRLLANHPLPAPTVAAVPTLRQIEMLADKAGLHRAAESIGLACASWVEVTSRHDEPEWPPLPSVVKSGGSQIAILSRKAVLVQSPEERDAAVQRVFEHAETAVIEEFVRGTPWRVYFAADDAAFTAVPSLTTATYPTWGGVARKATIDPVAPPEAVLAVAAVERLVSLVAYRGIGNMQFIHARGELHLHDVNLRVPAAVALPIAAGFDLPRIAVDIACRKPDAVPRLAPVLRSYLWAEGEVRAALDQEHGTRARALAVAAGTILSATARRHTTVDPIDLIDPLVAVGAVTRLWRSRRPD